jgi:hypothetical protein
LHVFSLDTKKRGVSGRRLRFDFIVAASKTSTDTATDTAKENLSAINFG